MKKDIYNDSSYFANNPTWHEEDAAFKVANILKVLDGNLSDFNAVCEVGCGSGAILVQMSKHFPKTSSWTGYDISQNAIDIANKKTSSKLNFKLKEITLEDEAVNYDLMLVIDVIEHLENYFSFLDAIVSRSQYFVLHIPLDMSLWSLLREGILIESKNRVGHIHNFTEDFIKSILQDHGFHIIKQIYTEPISKAENGKQHLVNFIRKTLHLISPRLSSKIVGGYSIMLLAKSTQ